MEDMIGADTFEEVCRIGGISTCYIELHTLCFHRTSNIS